MAKKKTKTKKTKSSRKTTATKKELTFTIDEKTNLPSLGGYYIRPKLKGFSLYLKRYENGKPITPHFKIDEAVFYLFGLSPDMDATKAKEVLKEFRGRNKASRLAVAKQARTFERYKNARTINRSLFPENLVSLFERKITEENFGSHKHLEKKFYIFATVQEIMNELELTPEIYAENARRIFKYFVDNQYSLNYCQKLISIMNEWGKFATARGSGYYKVIPQPKGNAREKINDASSNKNGVRKEAIPMTQDLLNQIIGLNQLHPREINFLKATFYLGLRPEELMKSIQGGKHYSKVQHISGIEVVSIYQEKLKGVKEDKRTKHIPIKWDEQKEAVKIIEDYTTQIPTFKKPTYKALKKVARALNCNSGNKALGLYSGRKGFTNWCFEKGETDFVGVASWMGHLDTSTTYAIYLDRNKVLLGNSGNTPPKASGE